MRALSHPDTVNQKEESDTKTKPQLAIAHPVTGGTTVSALDTSTDRLSAPPHADHATLEG